MIGLKVALKACESEALRLRAFQARSSPLTRSVQRSTLPKEPCPRPS